MAYDDLPRAIADSRPIGWLSAHCPDAAASTTNVAIGCALTFAIGFASIWYAGGRAPMHSVTPLTAADIAIPSQIPYPRIYVAAVSALTPPAVILPVERVYPVDIVVPTKAQKKKRRRNR